MIAGQLGIACQNCGNTSDPLGVMEDGAGRLVCFWCQSPDTVSDPPPSDLAPAWCVGDDYTIEIMCEDHAREFASERGLVWEYPGSTGESPNGYAYALVFSGELESDYPHACAGYDAHDSCDLYLDTALTEDGRQYVRDNYPANWWPLWGVDA
jgi:hypothetical protein